MTITDYCAISLKFNILRQFPQAQSKKNSLNLQNCKWHRSTTSVHFLKSNHKKIGFMDHQRNCKIISKCLTLFLVKLNFWCWDSVCHMKLFFHYHHTDPFWLEAMQKQDTFRLSVSGYMNLHCKTQTLTEMFWRSFQHKSEKFGEHTEEVENYLCRIDSLFAQSVSQLARNQKQKFSASGAVRAPWSASTGKLQWFLEKKKSNKLFWR